MDKVLISIVSMIVGAGVTWNLNLILRKEKFKEIIYKERLAAYKEIFHGCRELLIAYFGTLNIPQTEDQIDKLQAEIVKLQAVIGRHIVVISEAVFTEAVKLMRHAGEPPDGRALFTGTGGVGEEIGSKFVKSGRVQRKYWDTLDAIRKDLFVDVIAEEIKKTMDFPVYKRNPEVDGERSNQRPND